MAMTVMLDHKSIVTDYTNDLDIKTIAAKNNCSRASVCRIAKLYGVMNRKEPGIAHGIRHDYFSVDSPHKATLLNFLKNKASIYTGGGKSVISIRGPIEMLLLLKTELNINNKIYNNQLQFSSRPIIELLNGF